MQQIQRMPFSTEGIIGSVASGLVGWLAASLTKVSRAEHEKSLARVDAQYKELVTRLEAQNQLLLARVDALEKDLSSRMTRTDFDKSFGDVKDLVRDFRNETRSEFKELKIELKTKT